MNGIIDIIDNAIRCTYNRYLIVLLYSDVINSMKNNVGIRSPDFADIGNLVGGYLCSSLVVYFVNILFSENYINNTLLTCQL